MKHACALFAALLAAEDDVASARRQHNVAANLYLTGHYAEAEAGYRAALPVLERSGAEAAPTLTALSVLLRTTGRYAESETMARRAIAIRGDASDWHAVAEVERITGRSGPARASLAAARRKLPEVGPDRDPVLLAILQTESAILLESGDLTAAGVAQGRVLDLATRIHGPTHRAVAHARNGLGMILLRVNRLPEAEREFREALSILGSEPHPWTIAVTNNLAQALRWQGRRAEAEPLYRTSLTASEAKFGPDHPGTAQILLNLGELFVEQRKLAGAEKLYRQAVSILEARFGVENAQVKSARDRLAGVYRMMNRHHEAARVYGLGLAGK